MRKRAADRKRVPSQKTFGSLYLIIAAILTCIAVAFSFSLIFPQKKVQKEVPLLSCSGDVDDAKLSRLLDDTATGGTFLGEAVVVPPKPRTELAQVLGDQAPENKRIEINLATQHVTAYEGSTQVFSFLVSTGLWYPTPTGTFTIQRKVRSQLMKGGDPALHTYYYLPNVPYVMYFGNAKIPWNRGFSLHGAYWHNNFGKPMSHGCVNMRIPDSEALYNWAPIGTPVVIY